MLRDSFDPATLSKYQRPTYVCHLCGKEMPPPIRTHRSHCACRVCTVTRFKNMACCPTCEPRFNREIVLPEVDRTPGNNRRTPIDIMMIRNTYKHGGVAAVISQVVGNDLEDLYAEDAA